MEEPETATRGPARATCPSCGGNPQWESVLDADEERWLLPGITIHTGNPVGRERMVRVLRMIQRLHAVGYGRGEP